MQVGVVYDPVFLKHDTGEHSEHAGRLKSIVSHLQQDRLDLKLVSIPPRPASVDELGLVHEPQHIKQVEALAKRGGGYLDAETIVSADSFEAACYAAGGTIRAAEEVINGTVNSAFALVRPPGHHATAGKAMGFCLFNNVAVAARYIQTRYALDRIAIIDFDVHHGNGTQRAFYADPRVLYISLHQFPLFPGTGIIEETGSGDARGTNINIPLPAGCGDEEYLLAFDKVVLPAVRRFKPRLILVSAGYDSHWADELAAMECSVRGFIEMVALIKGLAEENCQGRLVAVLEGGYHLAALAASVKSTFEVLLDCRPSGILDPLGPPPYRFKHPDITELIDRIRETHGLL